MAQFSRFFHKFAINRKFLFYKLESFREYFFLNRGVLESFGEFFFKLESFREFFTNSRLIANFFSFFLIAKTLENTSGESPRLPGISMYVYSSFFGFSHPFFFSIFLAILYKWCFLLLGMGGIRAAHDGKVNDLPCGFTSGFTFVTSFTLPSSVSFSRAVFKVTKHESLRFIF